MMFLPPVEVRAEALHSVSA